MSRSRPPVAVPLVKHMEAKETPRNWREDEPTDKQLRAIFNMNKTLNWIVNPKTKGDCCDVIDKMIKALAVLPKKAPRRWSGYDDMDDRFDGGAYSSSGFDEDRPFYDPYIEAELAGF